MSREYPRNKRIGDQIQREIADLLLREVKDPRLGMITISGVDVSRDLAHAKVYISVLSPGVDINETLAVLKRTTGFLRHHLGKRMKIRTVPELHFFHDTSFDTAERISKLIDNALTTDKDDEDKQEGGPPSD